MRLNQKSEPLSPWQITALTVYAGGDYSYVSEYSFDDDYGDSLLTFVMAELSYNEDCESRDMALRRIEAGIADLETVRDELSKLLIPVKYTGTDPDLRGATALQNVDTGRVQLNGGVVKGPFCFGWHDLGPDWERTQ